MAQLIRSHRAMIALAHDVIMAALSFAVALYLRVGADAFGFYADQFLVEGTVIIAALVGLSGLFFGLYRGIWRYASLDDMLAIVKTVAVALLIFLPIMFLYSRLADVPRSLPVIQGFVLIAMLAAPRIAYRILRDRRLDYVLVKDRSAQVPVLLYGAGDEAELFLRALKRDPVARYWPVGIIADKPGRVGRRIHNVEVYGLIDNLAEIARREAKRGRRPQQLVVSFGSVSGEKMRTLFDAADGAGMALSRVPKQTELREGIARDAQDLRPIAIEDLLGRAPVSLDREAMAELIAGRRVLVTGAGGSIGSELVRQVSDAGPASVGLLDHSEFALYEIDRELGERHPALPRTTVLADIRDRQRVADTFARVRPEIVFHAAALKHVPMVETNPLEGLMTNVIGTRHVADACRDHGVAEMVLISTDKAVNPTSVMGASKRLAEAWCQALDVARGTEDTRFVTVRFGNVLGSTGSVVPLFQKQLAAGGPLTVTHRDVTRYFMTVGEAVELVLAASALGASSDSYSGKLFVLDMGEPVRIDDLAHKMIRLAGLEPEVDIQIRYVGLRPGEKLHEELLHDSEDLVETGREGLLLAAPRTADAKLLARALDELADHCQAGDADAALGVLARHVPEFDHRPSATPGTARHGGQSAVRGAAE